MFGEVRGAATAITGNTFTPVTLLWMGRVKRGGKSSQVHRKVMIQTVYNRISPPTSRPLSLLLYPPLPPSRLLSLSLSSSRRRFWRDPGDSRRNEQTFMTPDTVAPRMQKKKKKKKNGAIKSSARVSFEARVRVSFKYSLVLPLSSNDLATIFREIFLICLTIVKYKFHPIILSREIFFLFHFIFYAIGGNCNQDYFSSLLLSHLISRYVLFFR